MSTVNKPKVIDCLRELADRSFQERVWLASSGPEISSITEAVCGLFDDSGLDIALEKGHAVFTEEIDGLLRQLGKNMRAIDEFQPPASLMVDPKMDAVRQLATNILLLIEQK